MGGLIGEGVKEGGAVVGRCRGVGAPLCPGNVGTGLTALNGVLGSCGSLTVGFLDTCPENVMK